LGRGGIVFHHFIHGKKPWAMVDFRFDIVDAGNLINQTNSMIGKNGIMFFVAVLGFALDFSMVLTF
jgi:hypothetical protein